MPNYQYKAMNQAGKVSAGTMVAHDEVELARMLEAQGLFLTESRKADSNPVRAPEAAPLGARLAGKAKLQDLAVFNEQLAIMMRSSMPILETLVTLTRQQKNPSFKTALEDIGRCVRGGQSLAAAFSRYPGIFDGVYVSLLAAGEASGKMPEMLDLLCEYINFQIRIREKAVSALIYPSLVVSASFTAILFLVIFILPTFMEIFKEFHMQLPLSTRILLGASAFMRAHWLPLLGGVAAVGYGVWKTVTASGNARFILASLMDVPFVGTIVRNLAMTRVFKTLGFLTASGIPILQAIQLAKSSAGNQIFAEALDPIYRSASEGRGLAEPMSRPPFPDIVGGMIDTGEKTGTLPDILMKLAAYYEIQTTNSIQRFFTVLEPAFVAVLGMLVGGIAFSVLIPVFSLTQGF